MAVIRCKMCGGDLLLTEGATTAQCEYCGSLQTVPMADQEKMLNQFARANRLRLGCEFDKAFGVYETIVGEYPEEPEAYWGLVLCQYGIEYVDDPLTARKIPTCHRSSFQSVLEDSNYELALKYADEEARKLYRQEAKEIEKLRKGIQEISVKEAPYDIFICYKETKPDTGQRTLDSVLAQDLYDTLTARGYRVFFSRVTLEDKVGQEYEPYIFAALNSARIMLAVGTDYEHFQAVWVKNEWRRYLMLMQSDRDKHLIPCYKDMEIEDLPQEFRRLQAQNLGKVGADQDLLRGIDKLLPRGSLGAAPQRKVDPAVVALLERGRIALEDWQWEEADGCFEKVLQQDPKNAEGYIGKLLVQERRKSLEAVVEKWLDDFEEAQTTDHPIELKAKRYQPKDYPKAALNYVNSTDLEALYEFDGRFTSQVASREQHLRQGEQLWNGNRDLMRAMDYAEGELALRLREAKERFLEELKRRLKQARDDVRQQELDVKKAYAAHMEEANRKAAEMYRQGEKMLVRRYQELRTEGQKSTSPTTLSGMATELERMAGYKNSTALAADFRKRAEEIAAEHKAAQEAYKKKQFEEQSKIYKQELLRSRIKKVFWIIVMAVVLILAFIGMWAKDHWSDKSKDDGNPYNHPFQYTVVGTGKDRQ